MKEESGHVACGSFNIHLSKRLAVGNGQALLVCWTVLVYPWCMCTCQPKVITIATAIFYTLLTKGPTFIDANTTLQRVMCSCWDAWYGSEHDECGITSRKTSHFGDFSWLQTVLHPVLMYPEVLYVDVHVMILHVLKLFDSRTWGSPSRLASRLGPKGSGNSQ